jgi:ketosteroid isomerase-like protein
MMHEIAAAEQSLYRAMIEQDFEALDAILADDVVYVHSTAVAETKDGYLAGVRNGLYEYASVESDAATVAFSGDVAVQTGRSRMSVGARGQPMAAINLLVTLVWRREPTGWRLWRRHATRFP